MIASRLRSPRVTRPSTCVTATIMPLVAALLHLQCVRRFGACVTDVTSFPGAAWAYGPRVTTSETPDTGYLPVMLNPFEPGFFDDPYAQYRLVREQDPVHLSPIGSYALFRYDDVHHVLRDPSLSVEERNMTTLIETHDPDVEATIADDSIACTT